MLHRDTADGITTLALDHGKANAMDVELMTALENALHELERDDNTRALVVTGKGNIFCAGVDLFRVIEGGPDYAARFLPRLAGAFERLFRFPKPVVAAVNGHAIAGGCVIACAADYRLMASGRGTIGVPELKVGVPFPLVAIEILRFATGSRRLQELVYLGGTFPVTEAVQAGLIDAVVEPGDLLGRAVEMAGRLATEPQARFRITKQQLRHPTLEAIERHADETAGAVLRAWQDPETIGAIKKYLETTLRK